MELISVSFNPLYKIDFFFIYLLDKCTHNYHLWNNTENMSQTIGKCGNQGCNLENCEIHTTERCRKIVENRKQYGVTKCNRGLRFGKNDKSYCIKCQTYFDLTENEVKRLRVINSAKGKMTRIDGGEPVDPNTVFDNFREIINIFGRNKINFKDLSTSLDWNFKWTSEFCDEDLDWEHLSDKCIFKNNDLNEQNLYIINSNKKLQEKLDWKIMTKGAIKIFESGYDYTQNCRDFKTSLIVKFPDLPWDKKLVTKHIVSLQHDIQSTRGQSNMCFSCVNNVLIMEIRNIIDWNLFAQETKHISRELVDFVQLNPDYNWKYYMFCMNLSLDFIKQHSEKFQQKDWSSMTCRFIENDVNYIIENHELGWNFNSLTIKLDLEKILENPQLPWNMLLLFQRCLNMKKYESDILKKFANLKIIQDNYIDDPMLLNKIGEHL